MRGEHPKSTDEFIETNSQSKNRINLEPSDSCGVGLIASINDTPSNRILDLGLTSLANVAHRGAIASDGKTGDGCGILTDIPQPFLQKWLASFSDGLTTEPVGIGTVFLPQNNPDQNLALEFIKSSVQSLGFRIMGTRTVPINISALGKMAADCCPKILQLFVIGATEDPDELERRLFIARRTIELSPIFADFPGLHIASFSCRKIIYKGMVQSGTLSEFYPDLQDNDFQCSVCIYHQRFSTNTSPTWSLCQPFRMLAHNGEINTIRGNRNWMTAREVAFEHEYWTENRAVISKLFNFNDSDSASLDNCIELLNLSGREIHHALNMLVPPAWENDPEISENQKAFFEYHSCFCEPWDGPAAVVAFDGKVASAILDRNGLRPLRFKITRDDLLIIGSEAGADRDPIENAVETGRLGPGESVAVDLNDKRVIFNDELKENLANRHPYATWLRDNLIKFSPEYDLNTSLDCDGSDFFRRQIAAGLTKEELQIGLKKMALESQEPTFSMGVDTPLAVLSRQPRHLGDYFKQRFAQVTNPPIDPIRERSGMSLAAGLGPERNLLDETPHHCRIFALQNPILRPEEFQQLHDSMPFKMQRLDCTWNREHGSGGLEKALNRLVSEAQLAADQQNVVLVLSDKSITPSKIAIPMLLAVGAIHHGLNKTGQRMMCSLIAETAFVRDAHHLALLFGYGCTSVFPYLAFGSIKKLRNEGELENLRLQQCWDNYRQALSKGMLKIMSKMGISVLHSYQGAQIFESVGIGNEVIEKCFKYSLSNIGGVGFNKIAEDCLIWHRAAFDSKESDLKLFEPGLAKPKRAGEHHVINGKVTKSLHRFVREMDESNYLGYQEEISNAAPVAIRDLLNLKSDRPPVSIDQVESISKIRRRFTTAAMSLGAISPEAHEAIAIAMNEIGGKSNSGEGGEDPRRFVPNSDGSLSNSKIKQVASGRFGVNAEYLLSASEIEIKMAQGAKPGEGGQLPGFKVNELIARLRNTATGVTLISPPPHHDIYSIEDLAQLIFDLKMVNPSARVCVKLVSKTGVGNIALGVAKSFADVVLISGHEGGTGASPLTSIKHAGLPWEIGLSETHQNLVAGNLRDRVIVRVDGGIRTGLDIIKAAILGAEEYNFGTMALIALGCVYVKKCHLNTCPVGIATQDPKYRSKFKGKPENLINYLNAVAEECRSHLAHLGYSTIDEIVGRHELLATIPYLESRNINLDRVVLNTATTSSLKQTSHKYSVEPLRFSSFDDSIIKCMDWSKQSHSIVKTVFNTDRNIGTRLAAERTRKRSNGIAYNIQLELQGSAGQSLGTFLTDGIQIQLTGEANDYVGKGMSGGEIVIVPAEHLIRTQPVIAGNALLYGATGGQLFVAGKVAERFCVRNSGATAIVEGCGDHGCEYMTSGTAVILGSIGRNFGAGMTGGQAYVWDYGNKLTRFCNRETIEIVQPCNDQLSRLKTLIELHLSKTSSFEAARFLENPETSFGQIKLVMPKAEPKSTNGMHNKSAGMHIGSKAKIQPQTKTNDA